MKHRYFLEIAYNGSNYHGWQKQPGAISVQEVVNECISTLLGEQVSCIGCGRTDAGVHARKFILQFDTTKELNFDFAYKLNSFVPKDITVKKIYSLSRKIHARWDAIKRSYQYLITIGKDPFMKDLATISFEDPNIEIMNKACNILLEYNDFETFSKTHNSHNHYLCDLYEARWEKKDNLLIFTISANRFVRSMVRLIVGTMLMAGNEKISLDEFRSIIESKNRQKAGKAFPACGLYLTDVQYPEGILVELR
jgi:tRNA pseudouridine38-40 synthase